MLVPLAYADCEGMNNTWYVTQELASAHQRDLRELRGHSPVRRRPRQLHLCVFVGRLHRTPKAAQARHA
jgi:hypothetical protein